MCYVRKMECLKFCGSLEAGKPQASRLQNLWGEKDIAFEFEHEFHCPVCLLTMDHAEERCLNCWYQSKAADQVSQIKDQVQSSAGHSQPFTRCDQ